MASRSRASSSARRATSATRHPPPASWRATSAPIPDEAPTTTARCQGTTLIRRALPSAEIQPPAEDQAQHLERRAEVLPAARRVLRLPTAPPVVAHRDL